MENTCNNCQKEVASEHRNQALRVTQGPKLVALICGECHEGAAKTKIVVARAPGVAFFDYDQFQNIEMQKS